MRTCEKCGESFQEGMRSCPYCGQTVKLDTDISGISAIKSFDSSRYSNSVSYSKSEDYEYQRVLNNAKKYYILNIVLWIVIAVIQFLVGIPLLMLGYGVAVLSCAAWNIVISILMIVFMKDRFSSLENAYNYYYTRRTIAYVFMVIELFLGAMIGAFGNLADVLICRYVVKNAERIFNERNKNNESSSNVSYSDTKLTPIQEKRQITVTPGLSIESLIKRIGLFIEDGKWDEAYAYSEAALDVDATNFEVYLLKTQIEYKTSEISHLPQQVEESENYKKYLRFGGTPLEFVTENVTNNYEKVDFSKLKIVKVPSEKADPETLYCEGIKYMQEGQEYSYSRAIQCFYDVEEYKDSKEKIIECKEKIEALRVNRTKEEEERKSQIRQQRDIEKKGKTLEGIFIGMAILSGLLLLLNFWGLTVDYPEEIIGLCCPEIITLVGSIICFIITVKNGLIRFEYCKELAIVNLILVAVNISFTTVLSIVKAITSGVI